MRFDSFKEIEGYAEAVEKQDFLRDAIFIGMPEIICGLPVSPLTFRHLLWLRIIESPFIGESELDAGKISFAVAGFFKTIAPIGKPAFMLTPFDYWHRWNLRGFMHKVGRIKADEAMSGIIEFVRDAFMDAPSGSDRASESYYSAGASMTHALAEKYHGLNANPAIYPGALDIPLKAGFQLLKLIRRDNLAAAGKPSIMFNGLSDQIKTRWLEKQQPEKN